MDYYKWNDVTDEEWSDIIHKQSSNYMSYFENENRRISNFEGEEEELQLRQLIEIMGQMNILQEMEKDRVRNIIKEELTKKGVIYKECIYTSEELKNKWLSAFLPNITDKEKTDIYLDQYLWHAFTYHKIENYLEGDNAAIAFDKEKKDEIYMFWQGKEETYHIETKNQLTTRHLRLEQSDLYIVDSKFTWTYILKHCDDKPIWYKKVK